MPLSSTSAVSIRALAPTDAPALAALRLEVAADSEVAIGCTLEEEAARPIERLQNQLASTLGATFGAFGEGHLVGTASVLRPEFASTSHKAVVWGVLVSPRWRGRAVGRRLVEACVGHAIAGGASRVNLTVFVSSQAAIRLYESIGFVVYGREPQALRVKGFYYDALLMSLATEGHNPSTERTCPGKPGHAAHGER